MARHTFEADAEAANNKYTPVPEAIYELKVDEITPGMTKPSADFPKGRAKTDLTILVNDGEHEGRKMWHTITWIAKGDPGHYFTLVVLRAMGLPWEGSVDVDDVDLLEKVFRGKVGIKTYGGKKSNVILEFIDPNADDETAAPKKAPVEKKPVQQDLEEVPF